MSLCTYMALYIGQTYALHDVMLQLEDLSDSLLNAGTCLAGFCIFATPVLLAAGPFVAHFTRSTHEDPRYKSRGFG